MASLNDEIRVDVVGLPNKASAEPIVSDDKTFAFVPDGYSVQSLLGVHDAHRDRPKRAVEDIKINRIDSAIACINRFKSPESTVAFARIDRDGDVFAGFAVRTIFDYHEQARANNAAFAMTFKPRVSREWCVWQAIAKQDLMSQEKFAEFLGENIGDVVSPDDPLVAGSRAQEFAQSIGSSLASPISLMRLARDLTIHVDSTIAGSINLSSGESQISYGEAHNAKSQGESVRIPGAFAIAVPVFDGTEPYLLLVRLVYRVKQGRVMWKLAIHRQNEMLFDACSFAIERIEEQTGIPVYEGWPE